MTATAQLTCSRREPAVGELAAHLIEANLLRSHLPAAPRGFASRGKLDATL